MTMKPSEIYASGYALCMYDINNDENIFRFNDETYRLSVRAVPIENMTIESGPIHVALIEDVRKAAAKTRETA